MNIRSAALLAISRLGAVVSSAAEAQPAPPTVTFSSGFEGTPSGWTLVGGAGYDLSQGYARTGVNNGYIRASGGWNAIQSTGAVLNLSAGWLWQCAATSYLRSSGNVSGLFMSILSNTGNGSIIKEVGPKANFDIGFWPNYQILNFAFTVDNRPALYAPPKAGGVAMQRPSKPIAFRVGFWGNGADAWVQVDDVSVSCTGGSWDFN